MYILFKKRNKVKLIDNTIKPGDLVTDLLRGQGMVRSVNNTSIYPIIVIFKNYNCPISFTADGKYDIEFKPSLYKNHHDSLTVTINHI